MSVFLFWNTATFIGLHAACGCCGAGCDRDPRGPKAEKFTVQPFTKNSADLSLTSVFGVLCVCRQPGLCAST